MSFQEFNESLKNLPENSELLRLLNEGLNKDILYDALAKTYSIPYNAIRFKNEDNESKMSVVFQFKDIDNLVNPIKNLSNELIKYFTDKNIAIEKSFEICKNNYKLASSYDQRSSLQGMIQNDGYNRSMGLFGTFYDFNEIDKDTWEQIKKDIIKKIN